ncbi:hypothetical protein V5O48_016952 [Marasmius crinis-equi]|uniref:FAD-binding PCMH-type domain-containing protein n=1 Tax=Marasmius crinis-equi TaxID=585013 RepID=A0ABR3EQB3_9AGAR
MGSSTIVLLVLALCSTPGTFLGWFPILSAAAQVLEPPSSGAVDASMACQYLQRRLGYEIVAMPGDSEYSNGTHSAWNYHNTEFLPACIILPREASHVQEAIKTIYDREVNYAVQAGGHSAMKGWNNVQNGILILFTFMDDVTYDAKRDTITLLPGVRWGQAVSTLEPFGVAPVGGRVNDVGTGLLLGGGLSFLSPKHGFGADTFVELDIVLQDGRLVTATVDNEYRDLFKALKGGANRLGIVTRYEVTAVHTGGRQDKRWFGGIIMTDCFTAGLDGQYPETALQDVLHAVAQHIRESKDPNAAILTFIGCIVSTPDAQNVTTLPAAALFYNGGDDNLTATETERVFNTTFSRFLSLPRLPTSFVQQLSYSDISELMAEGPAQMGLGQYFGASTFGPDDSINRYIDAVRLNQELTTQFKSIVSTSVVAFTPVLDNQIQVGRQRGGNVINPPLGGYNAVQFQVSVNPGASSHELAELNAARAKWFERLPGTPGLPLYINECDKHQNVFETYGDYDHLRRTYSKYDPTQYVFLAFPVELSFTSSLDYHKIQYEAHGRPSRPLGL